MDRLIDGLVFMIIIAFSICFVISFGSYYIGEQRKRFIKRINDLSMTYINNYYKSNKLRMDEIEKTLLTEIACLATKNNNDIKEIKDKITTGKKSKRINQLVDENNKLKEENKKLKEENTKLNDENNKLKKEKGNKILNNNPFSYWYMPVYNPYTGVINNMCCSLDNQNKYRW